MDEPLEYTKYEKARLIGSRALQIAMGAPILVKLDDEDFKRLKYNPISIAKMEFEADVLPITVRRPMPERGSNKNIIS